MRMEVVLTLYLRRCMQGKQGMISVLEGAQPDAVLTAMNGICAHFSF